MQEFVKTDDHLGVVQSRDELNAELLSTQVRGVLKGVMGGGVGYRVQGAEAKGRLEWCSRGKA